MIEVAARPSPIGVDLLYAAVVVIDMQNDFAAPDGMFDDAGIDLGCRTFSWCSSKSRWTRRRPGAGFGGPAFRQWAAEHLAAFR